MKPCTCSLVFVLALLSLSMSAFAQEGPPGELEPKEEAPAKDAAPVREAPPAKKAAVKKPRTIKPKLELGVLLSLGLKNAASIKAEEAAQRKAEWTNFRAQYAWTPKLRATTLVAPVPGNTDPNNVGNNLDELLAFNIGPFVRQTASLLLPVYTFGRISSAQELAKINKKVAALDYNKARSELFFQIRQAYFGLQLARGFTTMLRDGDKLIKKRLEEMEEAREFGDADFKVKDFRKLQIFSAELDSRALDNDKLVTLAIAGMEYLTGRRVELEEIPAFDEKSKPKALGTLAEYQSLASAKRPEIRQLQHAVQARRAQLKLEKAGWYPNLFVALNFTFGYSNKEIARQQVCEVTGTDTCDFTTPDAERFEVRAFSNPYNQLTVGAVAGLNWSFDFPQTYGKVQETQAALEQTVAQQSQAMGAIELEIKKLHLEASQAREKIEIQGRRLRAARRWRDQIGLSAQNAGADVSRAIEPLKAFYEARVLYLQALYDYRVARAALAKGLGVDMLPEKKK